MTKAAWIEPLDGPWGRLTSGISLRAVDVVSSATPLVAAKGDVFAAPLDLFLGRITGSVGETSAAAVLLGGIFLVIVGVANWRTVVSILGSFAILNVILRLVAPEAIAPVLFNLLSGGLLFGNGLEGIA